MNLFSSKRTRLLVNAFGSAIAYGLWTLFVNYDTSMWLMSTLVQTSSSFFAGFAVAYLVELVFGKLNRPWRFWVASLLPYWVILCMIAVWHYTIGTEYILATLAPNFFFGTGWLLYYCSQLEKQETQPDSEPI
ncbi:hypothetical protein NBRC116493_05030 [Aurantivibrio infirmus]